MKYCTDENGVTYQLQRCPFCGMESAELITQAELWGEGCEDLAGRYTVCCSRDTGGCGATCGFHDSPDQAVSRWNTRVVI